MFACRKKIASLLMLLAFSSASEAGAGLKEKFVKATGLREPVSLEQISGPEECQSGHLFLNEIDDGTLTLMLGAHPLILGIGPSKATESTDRECKTRSQPVKYSKGKIEALRKTVCAGVETTYFVSVKISSRGIEYHRRNTTKDNAFIDIKCKYKYN